MHGLINRAIEMFVRQTYGGKDWIALTKRLDLGFTEFEAMLTYEDAVTEQVLDGLSTQLDKDQSDILEDIGTFLVSHSSAESLRRLLRFSGRDFVEFLHSLEDLPARARLALDDLNLPRLELKEHNLDHFSVVVRDEMQGPVTFGYVLMGLLRALADDFGALVLLEHKGGREGTEVISISLLHNSFTEGRRFELAVNAS